MKLLCLILCFVLLGSAAPAEDAVAPIKLSEAEIQLLGRLLTLKPGMTEAEVRKHFPKLGAQEAPAGQQPGIALRLPAFSMGGLKWHNEFRMMDGKLQEVALSLTAQDRPNKYLEELQVVGRERVRAVGLAIAAFYQQRIGRVAERYVPNQDCPAGNPFGLRHTWLTRKRALALEFSKNASYSNLSLRLADWKTWNRTQKEDYRGSWPLRRPTAAELQEASGPLQ